MGTKAGGHMKLYYLFFLLILTNAKAQHVEINLFEKTSHKKYVDYQVNNFMKSNKVAGFTFILANKGRVVYSKALGIAEYNKNIPMTLNSPLPIQKSSLLFTAAATLKLVQEGKLSPEDLVFGPKSIFEKEIPNTHKFINAMTVRHLLDRIVWTGSSRSLSSDKMFNIKFSITNMRPKIPNAVSTRENTFCYYILGRIIEKISGMTYEEYVKDMTKDVFKNELKIPQVVDKKKVIINNKVHTIRVDTSNSDCMGGIHCSSGDLMNFILSIDGQSGVKDILIPTALRIMNANNKFLPERSKGWNEDKEGFFNYSSDELGSTLIRMRKDGITWILCALGGKGENFYKKADDLPAKILKRVKNLP